MKKPVLCAAFFSLLAVASPTERVYRRADSCGVKGFSGTTPAYLTKTGSAASTLTSCGALCYADSKCNSFAIGSNTCYLFTKTVATNVNQNSNSPYLYYDRGCYFSGSSSSSATTRTSSVTSTAQPASSSICGGVGYDKTSPDAYDVTSIASATSVAGCAAYCRASSGCLSFAVGSGECYLYSASLTNNFNQNSASPYKFYELGCVAASSSSASSAISVPLSSSTRTTSSTTLATVTLTTITASTPTGTPSCGAVGYDTENPQAYDLTTATSYQSLAGCSSLCRSNASCKSFALGNGYCLVYTAVVTGNFKSDANSPYKFYDLVCVSASSSSSSSPTTPISTSSSSSSPFTSSLSTSTTSGYTSSSSPSTVTSSTFTSTLSEDLSLSASSIPTLSQESFSSDVSSTSFESSTTSTSSLSLSPVESSSTETPSTTSTELIFTTFLTATSTAVPLTSSSISSPTPTPTTLPLLGPFYIQAVTAEASNAVILGSCGLWETGNANAFAFASGSWNVANKPVPFYLNQTTGYINSPNGLIAGTAVYCFDECDSLTFVLGYNAAQYAANSAIQPITCAFSGVEGSPITCTQRRVDYFGAVYDYGVVGFQPQSSTGTRVMAMGTYYGVPYQLRAISDIQSCVGQTGSG